MRGKRRLKVSIEREVAAGVQRAGEHRHLEPTGDGGADGDADRADGDEQEETEADIRGHADAGKEHRRLGILAREEARVEHLDENEGREPEGERRQHGGGGIGVDAGEGAALEQHGDDRLRGDEERDRRRQRQQQRHFERPVLAGERRRMVVRTKLMAELRQEHDADGDADDAERKLEQAVGVIEPRHYAILEARR